MNIFSNQSSTNSFDILQNARQDLCSEIQAVIDYDNRIKSTTDPIAKHTWINIRNEELTHVGETLGLLNYLDPEQKQYVQLGLTEFEKKT